MCGCIYHRPTHEPPPHHNHAHIQNQTQQPEVVSKVQGELAAHVAALEEKREVAEVFEDVVDFEDYMVSAGVGGLGVFVD